MYSRAAFVRFEGSHIIGRLNSNRKYFVSQQPRPVAAMFAQRLIPAAEAIQRVSLLPPLPLVRKIRTKSWHVDFAQESEYGLVVFTRVSSGEYH